MQPDEIKSEVDKLPVIRLEPGHSPEDSDIWEYDDGEAYVMVMRHTVWMQSNSEVIFVTVSGPDNDRERVIAEFGEVFGESISRETTGDEGGHTDSVAWLRGATTN